MPSLRRKWKQAKERWKSDISSHVPESSHSEPGQLGEPIDGQNLTYEAPTSTSVDTCTVPETTTEAHQGAEAHQATEARQLTESATGQVATDVAILPSRQETPVIADTLIASIRPITTEPPPTVVPARSLWADAVDLLTESEKGLLTTLQSSTGIIEELTVDRIDDLIDLTNLKQIECQQKSWKIRLGDQEIILRDVAQSVISWLNTFKEVGDIAVQFDTTGASLPWAGFRFFVQLVVSERDQMAGLLLAMERITRIVARCRIYETLYTPATTNEDAVKVLRAALVHLYSAILRTLALSYNLYNKNTAARALHALFTPGHATSLTTRLAALEGDLSLEVEMCENMRKANVDQQTQKRQDMLCGLLVRLKDQISIIDEKTSNILQKLEQYDQLAILDWTSPLPYSLYHQEIREARAEHTCEWLLNHIYYKEWMNSDSPAVLWISGFPGSGKTFLASKVIDDFQQVLDPALVTEPHEQDINGFAFFYCSRHEEDRNSPLSVLRSLVRQLATSDWYPDRVHESVVQLYEKSKKSGSGLTVNVCKDLLLTLVKFYPNTTIVLDALDECDERSRSGLMDVLDDLLKASPGSRFKLLVCSRPDADIRERFKGVPIIEIQATDNHDDIAIFVNQEIVKHPRWAKMDERLKSEVIATLLHQSKGMFQWTYLQIRQLLEECRTPVAIRGRLGRLPKDLKLAYDEIYAKIQARHEHEREIAHRAFQWVLVTYVPISTKALLIAVSQDPDSGEFGKNVEVDEELLLELCSNLLVIDSQFDIWRFSHLSVAEYLETHCMSAEHCHLAVAKVGLSWLLANESRYKTFMGPVGKSGLGRYFIFYTQAHVGSRQGQNRDTVLQYLLNKFIGTHEKTSSAIREWLYQMSSQPRQREIGLDANDEPIYFASAWGLTCLLDLWAEKGHISQPLDRTRAPGRINLAQVSKKGLTPLALAAWNYQSGTCRALVALGSDPNQIINGPSLVGVSALSVAASGDRYMEVATLVELGADPNLILPMPSIFPSAIAAAVNYGAFRALTALISAGARPDLPPIPEIQGRLLRDVVIRGDDRILSVLLEAGLDIKTVEMRAYVDPLAHAITIGKGDLVALMFNSGANPNFEIWGGDRRSGSALEIAILHRCYHLIPVLIQAGANVNQIVKAGHYGSALAAAVSFESHNMRKPTYAVPLLDAGADINMILEAGDYGSALAVAAAHSNTATVKFLLEQGANADMVLLTGDYGSALVAAAQCTDPTILSLFLEKGADTNLEIKVGRYGSALAAASRHGSYINVRALLDHGADANVALDVGLFGSALAAAARNGDQRVISLLLESGAQVNAVLESGIYGSALAAASASGIQDAVDLLLSSGADVNPPLSTGIYGSPLAASVVHGDIKCVEQLLGAGADVNMSLPAGQYGSALAAAATVGTIWIYGMILLLLQHGADVNMPLDYGSYGSALAAAAAHRNTEAVRTLLGAGANANQQLSGPYGNALIATLEGVKPWKDPGRQISEIQTILRYLLSAGADAGVISDPGKGSAYKAVEALGRSGSWPATNVTQVMEVFRTFEEGTGHPADDNSDDDSHLGVIEKNEHDGENMELEGGELVNPASDRSSDSNCSSASESSIYAESQTYGDSSDSENEVPLTPRRGLKAQVPYHARHFGISNPSSRGFPPHFPQHLRLDHEHVPKSLTTVPDSGGLF